MTYLRALRGARRAQDRHHRRAASRVIDVRRREAALVVMGVPERQLLAAVGYTEGAVDVEYLHATRRYRGAELVDERDREPPRIGLAWRILQPADGRLRAQRRAALRTAADRNLHQRIVPKIYLDVCLWEALASVSRARRR
jgi:hypothetical protein